MSKRQDYEATHAIGYSQAQFDEEKSCVMERLFAIEADGSVWVTEWRKFSHTFGKRAQFKRTDMTLADVDAIETAHYCGRYNLD